MVVGDRYRLIEVIGAGGMGRVWLADDEVLGRRVAVKEITAPPADLPDGRTVAEARAAAMLDHPNVVRVFDVLWWSGRSWIVMEYAGPRSLHTAIEQDGPLSHRDAARAGLQMLAALRAAHAAGVMHRDVKPHNVLLADDGRVVLTDFGLATTDGPDVEVQEVMGSPYYLAPERLGPGRSGPAGDLWSLGATLYAATEGRPPFARKTLTASLVAIATEEPDPPRRPGPLTPVILDLLAKDPAARPDAADLERQLRRILIGAVGVARPAGCRVPAPRANLGGWRGRASVPPTSRNRVDH
ncbi:serine/threonine protein kinase [Actinoplanes sp. TBRC 11911]|nr:serine/threonine protein kinase [Actinoplanes sp. TBRC 11911]